MTIRRMTTLRTTTVSVTSKECNLFRQSRRPEKIMKRVEWRKSVWSIKNILHERLHKTHFLFWTPLPFCPVFSWYWRWFSLWNIMHIIWKPRLKLCLLRHLYCLLAHSLDCGIEWNVLHVLFKTERRKRSELYPDFFPRVLCVGSFLLLLLHHHHLLLCHWSLSRRHQDKVMEAKLY